MSDDLPIIDLAPPGPARRRILDLLAGNGMALRAAGPVTSPGRPRDLAESPGEPGR